jgi:hypothetical protein
MNKLHLIAFNVPFPADYGGVIDIFYKIRAFHENGIKVILHCFEYGRHSSMILNEICHKVYYYPRSRGPFYWLDTLPYIVSTRISKELTETLRRDNHPVLFEGLHTTACLKEITNASKKRRTIVRTHNVEHDYYRGLMEAESNIPRKLYYYSEAAKLKRYEKVLNYAGGVAAISKADYGYFGSLYDNVNYVPAFHPYNEVDIQPGFGEYALFHGNLSVPENKRAVLYLIENVFREMDYPFMIAGKEPGHEIIKSAEVNDHIKVVSNPDDKEMDTLIRHAHINVLATFQATGIKLKLLSSLFRGRHCIVNPTMVEDTGLAGLCHVAHSGEEFRSTVEAVRKKEFLQEHISERRARLEEELSNVKNAQKLAAMLF